jgi:hypothetical protein
MSSFHQPNAKSHLLRNAGRALFAYDKQCVGGLTLTPRTPSPKSAARAPSGSPWKGESRVGKQCVRKFAPVIADDPDGTPRHDTASPVMRRRSQHRCIPRKGRFVPEIHNHSQAPESAVAAGEPVAVPFVGGLIDGTAGGSSRDGCEREKMPHIRMTSQRDSLDRMRRGQELRKARDSAWPAFELEPGVHDPLEIGEGTSEVQRMRSREASTCPSSAPSLRRVAVPPSEFVSQHIESRVECS